MYLKCSEIAICATCTNQTWHLYRDNDCFECMLKRTKECPTCKTRKSRTEFYKDSRTPDGIKSQCKTCHTKGNIKTRDTEKHRQANAEYMSRARKAYPDKFRERERAASKKRVRDERTLARTEVHTALRSGLLQKPTSCSSCGKEGRVTAHHADYSKALDVVWLCYSCHGREHRHA